MKINQLVEGVVLSEDDFTSVAKDFENVRHAHVEKVEKLLKAHPHVKNVKVTKGRYLGDTFKGTMYEFTYKGKPVHAEMSNTGFSLMTSPKSKEHLHSNTQLRSMKGFTKHLDTAHKAG